MANYTISPNSDAKSVIQSLNFPIPYSGENGYALYTYLQEVSAEKLIPYIKNISTEQFTSGDYTDFQTPIGYTIPPNTLPCFENSEIIVGSDTFSIFTPHKGYIIGSPSDRMTGNFSVNIYDDDYIANSVSVPPMGENQTIKIIIYKDNNSTIDFANSNIQNNGMDVVWYLAATRIEFEVVKNENGTFKIIRWIDPNIQDRQITTQRIENGAVTGEKIADDTIEGAKLKDQSIAQSKLQKPCVGTPELQDESISQAKMKNNSVGTPQIIDESVTNSKLADDSISQAKMQDDSVGTPQIIDESVNRYKLDPATVVNPLALYGLANVVGTSGTIDMDDFARTGWYKFPAGDVVNIVNGPPGITDPSLDIFQVIGNTQNSDYAIQIYYERNNNKNATWIRTKSFQAYAPVWSKYEFAGEKRPYIWRGIVSFSETSSRWLLTSNFSTFPQNQLKLSFSSFQKEEFYLVRDSGPIPYSNVTININQERFVGSPKPGVPTISWNIEATGNSLIIRPSEFIDFTTSPWSKFSPGIPSRVHILITY